MVYFTNFAYLYSLELSRHRYAKPSQSFSEHRSGQSWPVSKMLKTFEPYAYFDKILFTYKYLNRPATIMQSGNEASPNINPAG